MRLSTPRLLVIVIGVELLAVVVAGVVLPTGQPQDTNLRLWLTARATGIVTYLLLSLQVCLGILLSHPTNVSRWKVSKLVFPWHENLSAFVLGFAAVHVATIVLDPFAKVSLIGALIPGAAEYRPIPTAIGTAALYAGVLVGVTGRWTKLLPTGVWLKVHRLALVAWLGSWAHGVLSGTDTMALLGLYALSGVAVVAASAWRYSVVRAARRHGAAARSAPTAARSVAPTLGPAPVAAPSRSIAAAVGSLRVQPVRLSRLPEDRS